MLNLSDFVWVGGVIEVFLTYLVNEIGQTYIFGFVYKFSFYFIFKSTLIDTMTKERLTVATNNTLVRLLTSLSISPTWEDKKKCTTFKVIKYQACLRDTLCNGVYIGVYMVFKPSWCEGSSKRQSLSTTPEKTASFTKIPSQHLQNPSASNFCKNKVL